DRVHHMDVSIEDIEHDLPSDDEAVMERWELTHLVHRALGSLSSEQRAVIELAYFHGMHYSDIAQVMGCPENTVKTRAFHARKKLRVQLASLRDDATAQSPGSL
ncbi:MAG: RNA polymerase sigma factor, partial [Pyrinomonadaceae bacterium]